MKFDKHYVRNQLVDTVIMVLLDITIAENYNLTDRVKVVEEKRKFRQYIIDYLKK